MVNQLCNHVKRCKAWYPIRVFNAKKNATESFSSTFNTSENIILKMLKDFFAFRTMFHGWKTFDIFKFMNITFY